MLNDVSSTEVAEVMEAFESMTTVVKFANVNREGSDVETACQSYVDALVLLKKLDNYRGVSTSRNLNL